MFSIFRRPVQDKRRILLTIGPERAGKELNGLRFTIRQARTHAGLTQEAMARELGIDRGTYLRLEKDQSRATMAQLDRISRVTGIPAAWFFAESGTEV